jgi:hypothetical protein
MMLKPMNATPLRLKSPHKNSHNQYNPTQQQKSRISGQVLFIEIVEMTRDSIPAC